MAGLVGNHASFPAHCRRDANRAEGLIVPGRVDDRLSVARPGGIELEVVALFGQAMRRSVRQVANVEIAERTVDDLLSARRDGAPAQHFHRVA